MEVLKRIIGSQKVVMAGAGMMVTVIGGDSLQWQPLVTQSVGALFGLLVVVQGVLDFKHGSPSDHTGEFKV